MLQSDRSAILLQNNNVLAFCSFSTIGTDNKIPVFGCYNYANEREDLIDLKKKETKMESIRSFFKDAAKKGASVFKVT